MTGGQQRIGRWLAGAGLVIACAAFAPGASACGGPCAAADYDADGVNDWSDNCPLVSNAGQGDNDKDTPVALVDAGKPQGVPNTVVLSTDSPVRVYAATPYQTGQPAPSDSPADKGGDACDDDADNDGVKDRGAGGKAPDNCPLAANPDQRDSDADGEGDACDGSAAVAVAASAAPAAPARIRASAPRALRFEEIALGISVPVSCTARCQVAGRLALGRRVLGRGSAFLDGAGTTYLFVRVPARSVRRLAREHRVVRPVLTVTANGAAVSKRRLELRR